MAEHAIVLVVKVTALLSIALLLDGLLRRKWVLSMAAIWNSVVLVILVLPLTMLVVPRWTLPVLSARRVPHSSVVSMAPPGPGAKTVTSARLSENIMRSSVNKMSGATENALIDKASDNSLASSPAIVAVPIVSFWQTAQMVWGSIYVLGVVLASARLLKSVRLIHVLCRKSVPVAERAWLESLDRWLTHTGLNRPTTASFVSVSPGTQAVSVGRPAIRLLTSNQINVPVALGVFDRVILIPTQMTGETTKEMIDSVLLHELGHHLRADCAWQFLQRVVEVLFWFHPLVWVAQRRIAFLRERACDDFAVHAIGDIPYVNALLKIAAGWSSRQSLALGMAVLRGGSLARRLAAMQQGVGSHQCQASTISRWSIAGGALLCMLALASVMPGRATAEPPLVIEGVNKATQLGKPQTSGSTSMTSILGRIIGPDGLPAKGADIAVIGRRNVVERGGDLSSNAVVLAEAIADDQGMYQVTVRGVSSKSHRDVQVLVRTAGSALAWQRFDLSADKQEISVELKPESPISGRLIDLEGRPATNVSLVLKSISPTMVDGVHSMDGTQYWDLPSLPAAWPPKIISDENGAFVIPAVPAGHGVYLKVEGNDRFAPQTMAINTGMAEERRNGDGTYRPQGIKNLSPGEQAIITLSPAQIITGQVTFEDTGKPVPHARLTIWASQEDMGSMIAVPGQADAEGRYRISPYPGIQFGVTAYPPDDTPYLVRQVQPVHWKGGDRAREINIALPRGVVVHGVVREADSNTPVAGVVVQYEPESSNNPNDTDDIVTGWQVTELGDDDGRFEIVVLPGPGHLVVHAPDGNYVLQEMGSNQLYEGHPGGRRNYAHAFEPIKAEKNSGPMEVEVRLQRGATVSGAIVNSAESAPGDLVMIHRLQIHPHSTSWSGTSQTIDGGRFELTGLEPNHEYPVHFLDAKRKLGATAKVKVSTEPARVMLDPCGSVTMRFLDDAGMPVADYESSIHMVVNPGGVAQDFVSMRKGIVAADSDFIANVDRLNHCKPERSKSDGRLQVEALIPGASYRILSYRDERFGVAKDFEAKAGVMIDLGDITVERQER